MKKYFPEEYFKKNKSKFKWLYACYFYYIYITEFISYTYIFSRKLTQQTWNNLNGNKLNMINCKLIDNNDLMMERVLLFLLFRNWVSNNLFLLRLYGTQSAFPQNFKSIKSNRRNILTQLYLVIDQRKLNESLTKYTQQIWELILYKQQTGTVKWIINNNLLVMFNYYLRFLFSSLSTLISFSSSVMRINLFCWACAKLYASRWDSFSNSSSWIIKQKFKN